MRALKRNSWRTAPAGALLLFATLFAAASPAAAADDPVRIGITQIVQHPSLDESRRGFIDALTDAGYAEGIDVVYEIENAQGDIVNANVIANQFAGANLNLVLAIATPTAQAVANVIQDVPVLITAVTDPLAARLIESFDRPGTNVTGTADLAPVGQQMDLLKEVVPDAARVGVLYNAGEANSVVQVDLTRSEAEKRGMSLVEVTVSNSSEVYQAAQSLRGRVDAIYLLTDNTVISSLEAIIAICEDNDIPLFASEGDSVTRGAIATVGINYYRLGRQTGEMAVKVLNGADPATMPIEFQEDVNISLNLSAAERMGVRLSDDLVARAAELVGD